MWYLTGLMQLEPQRYGNITGVGVARNDFRSILRENLRELENHHEHHKTMWRLPDECCLPMSHSPVRYSFNNPQESDYNQFSLYEQSNSRKAWNGTYSRNKKDQSSCPKLFG